MYDKVSTSLNFVEREKEILEFWRTHGIVEKATTEREGCEVFTFFDGPPTANGRPHIGHVETRAIKDLIPRYKTMKGYQVTRKAGWDTHGLPVELEVEKALGINGKPQIENYGIEPFIQKCKESVWKYKTEWEQMSDRVGYWADMKHPYVTYEDNYIESEWWSLKTIAEKGLLYKGHKVVPYCPRCGTALSSHEVAQGYKDVTETSVYVKFKVKGQENTYLLAWTTTPWTLPSNVALVVNAVEDYVYAVKDGVTYILAQALCAKVLGDETEIAKTVKGQELVGMDYEPLYPFAGQTKQRGWYVVADSYVTLTDGTGIVHTAPAFGEDDARVGRENNLPFVQMVNTQGRFIDAVTPWAGMFVKDADPLIVEEMRQTGKLFAAVPYTHSYPFCWRCDTPLLYYARPTWFIKMTAVRDKLVANNRKVNWYPDNIKEGRMGNFLENVIDWGLSRERYWGTPLPVWQCECGHQHVIGSIEELKSMSSNCPDDIELHRPYIDKVTIKCPECGKEMHRVKEVIDCWFDSGSMPFAQWHYPFENQDIFKKRFPADFISEAVDQTRGWFYSLIAISTLLFHKAPYRNVIVLGHVQDKEGRKMSKSKGNAVDPMEALQKHGADAIRWYFYENSAPWLPNRFHDDAVQEGQRKFMGTLWNTYAFFVLYANIDNFDATKYTLDYDKLPVMDKWCLSRLNTMVKDVDYDLSNYRVTEAAKALEEFVDELSNWYVRRSRSRFWAKGMEQDKINAYMTLYTALVTTAKAAAPMIPFMTESIYRNLVCSIDKNAPESVHLCDFPKANEAHIDQELEKNMGEVLEIVVLGRAARNEANIKNRQPIGRMYVKAPVVLPDFYKEIVEEELNVKEVVFKDDMEAYLTYSFKPQFRVLGPKVGKKMGAIQKALKAVNGHKAKEELDTTGKLVVALPDGDVTLLPEDVEVTMAQTEGYNCQRYNGVTIALETTLSEELLEEGFVREIISKVQTMRKENGYEVTDHITVGLKGNEKLEGLVKKNEQFLKDITLADSVTYDETAGHEKEWNINGEMVTLSVK